MRLTKGSFFRLYFQNWSKNRASWLSRSYSTVAPGKAKLLTATAVECEETEEAKKIYLNPSLEPEKVYFDTVSFLPR